jgi:hypothetical protein
MPGEIPCPPLGVPPGTSFVSAGLLEEQKMWKVAGGVRSNHRDNGDWRSALRTPPASGDSSLYHRP